MTNGYCVLRDRTMQGGIGPSPEMDSVPTERETPILAGIQTVSVRERKNITFAG